MSRRDVGESGEVDGEFLSGQSPVLDWRSFSLSAGGSFTFSPMEEEEVDVDSEG